MATIYPAPKSGNGSSYVVGAGSGKPPKHRGLIGSIVHGTSQLAGNFAGDVKDTVIGLPAGLVQTVKHPVGVAQAVAGQEWQTWSPLFSGHPGQFLQQTYDHPLAPLLDVMTVFTLGVGATARGAEVLQAAGAEGRTVKALAGLRQAKSIKLSDPTHLGRQDEFIPLSTKPGRRLVQEAKLKILTPETGQRAIEDMNLKGLVQHLPKWWSNTRYERAYRKDMAHRSAALNQIRADQLQFLATLKAGGVLSDPKAWGEARMAIASNIWQGLERHAPKAYRVERDATVKGASGEAISVTKPGKLPKLLEHETYILDPKLMRDRVSSLDLKKPEDFESDLVTGKFLTTRDPAKAFRRDDGSVPVVPNHDATTLGLEGARSSAAVRWLWQRPTRAWKIAMVGYAPRTIINNGVGNWLMYAIRQGGDHSLAGLYDAIRITHGDRYARKMASPKLYGAHSQSWAYKWHMDELGNTFAHSAGLDGATAKTKVGKILSQGFYPIVHATADKPVRLAALASFYRGAPEVRALMKQGYKFDDAVDAAVANNPELRAAASERVRTVAGDYSTLNSVEKPLRDLVPFYLWDRHILKSAGATTAETPGRVAALQKISNLGEDETKKVLGEMPDFLKGALPLQLLGLHAGKGGRVNVMLTSGINPYETLAELASTGEALTTGTGQTGTGLNAAAFGVNPLITGAVQATTGRSLLTGAPVPTHGGVIPTVLSETAADLPIPKLIQALTSKPVDTSPKGNQLLYRHDVVNPASSLLGIPLRSVGKTASAKYAKAQEAQLPRF